jgi:hypothetical protein
MTPPAAWCLRIAGANSIVNGLGFGGFAIPAIVSVGQGHGIIYTFGNPTYGNGPFERIGVPTTVPLLAGFLAACVVQVAGGVLLLWPRPSGIVVSVLGILLGAPFWWGFNLPFAWLNAAVVLTFLALAWTAQKGSSRGDPSRGGGRSSAWRELSIRRCVGSSLARTPVTRWMGCSSPPPSGWSTAPPPDTPSHTVAASNITGRFRREVPSRRWWVLGRRTREFL